MLIAIAGSIGAGKSTVAAAVGERLSIPVHSIDADKQAEGRTHEDFEHWVASGIPFPDDFREAVFGRTLARLSDLSKTNEHVIVEETFHRKAIRERFFAGAGALLNGLTLIEVSVERSVALQHLASRAKSDSGHMAGRAMFDAFQSVAEPIENPDFTVANNGDLRDTVDEICRFLEERLDLATDGG